MKAIVIIISFVIFNPIKNFSQERDTTRTEREVESQIEEAFEEVEEEDLDSDQLAQFLRDLASNPVDINSAGLSELLQIPGMNLKIAIALIDYRVRNKFDKVEDLILVPGIGQVILNRIRPYVTVIVERQTFRNKYFNSNYWLQNYQFEFISRLQTELKEQRGYQIADSLGGFVGSPEKIYQRYRFQSRHLSVNLTQEKDAGESLTNPTDFDFNSFHIGLQNNGYLKDFVIGDYSLSFGQGLVLWNGGAFGKGREVTGTGNKNERGVRPYSSAQETDFYRGFAATVGGKIDFTVFYSEKPRTASVVSGDTTRFPSSTGFHRTLNEVSRKNNITQQVSGGRVRWETKVGIFGATGYVNTFSSYIAGGNTLSTQYNFEGRTNSVKGFDYRGLLGTALVFGEIAQSKNGAVGGVAGMEAPIGLNSDLTVLYRNYARDFQSFMAAGFSESSGNPRNEEGIYFGLAHSVNSIFRVSGYVDQFVFNSPRIGNSQSTKGYDVLGLVEARINRDLNFYILLRNEVKDDEFSLVNQRGVEEVFLGTQKRSSIRIQGEYFVSREVRMRSRLEYAWAQSAGEEMENGFLIYQDLRMVFSPKLRVDTRVTLFDTDSFASRVYQFENDLLYVLSNVALADRGQRFYFVVKYDVTHFFEIWFKYGNTSYDNKEVISSGLNEIQGNRRNSIGLQARLKF